MSFQYQTIFACGAEYVVVAEDGFFWVSCILAHSRAFQQPAGLFSCTYDDSPPCSWAEGRRGDVSTF